jgi:predicted CoA-binding protein
MTQNVNKITGPFILSSSAATITLTVERIIDVMEAAVRTFFSSPRFAVAGASQDQSKFGYRGEYALQRKAISLLNHGSAVLAWYHVHGLPVTPVNPRNPEIKLPSRSYLTVASPAALPSPTQTSLSIITPPPITRKVLEEAKVAGVPAVWLQPGSFDKEGLEFAKANFKAAIGGAGGDGNEGWCVLVDGETALKAADRQWTRQKL